MFIFHRNEIAFVSEITLSNAFTSIPYSIVINFLQFGINNNSGLRTKEISIYPNEICIASNFPDG